ncbi:MAG: hypothetical protein IPP77_05750 [Bacteroidetes bacterium]|nr:hypothetical protein [Bacteroidota bacterium]
MRKLSTLFLSLILLHTAFAQAPQKMSYQAVVRNASNSLVTSAAVGMRISILKSSASGTAVYVETQTPTTNANGLASLEIGTGTVVSGTFANIDWSSGLYFIKTETDPAGGTAYSVTATSQLMSVPYALNAKTADRLSKRSISLNIYGAYLPSGNATFSNGFGASAAIQFPDGVNSSFFHNFTVPADYKAGDSIVLHFIVSSTATGTIYFSPNAISIAHAGVGFVQGGTAGSGLTISPINITTANKPIEVLAYILSPDPPTKIAPGDGISFGFYRGTDANTGTFKIHAMNITY